MGAWDFGVFDDDVAYDALDDLRSAKAIEREMEKYFDRAIGTDYVEYDEGQYALVAAAVIDSALNGTEYRCDDDEYHEWTKSLDGKKFVSLLEKAAAAVEAVVADQSELRELWTENEEQFDTWLSDKTDIRDRLRQG